MKDLEKFKKEMQENLRATEAHIETLEHQLRVLYRAAKAALGNTVQSAQFRPEELKRLRAIYKAHWKKEKQLKGQLQEAKEEQKMIRYYYKKSIEELNDSLGE